MPKELVWFMLLSFSMGHLIVPIVLIVAALQKAIPNVSLPHLLPSLISILLWMLHLMVTNIFWHGLIWITPDLQILPIPLSNFLPRHLVLATTINLCILLD